MSDERVEAKAALGNLLHQRASTAVRDAFVELATSTDQDSHNLLASLLEMFENIADSDLDLRLCDVLEAGSVPPDRVGIVARFVLARDVERAMTACLARLDRAAAASAEETAARAALALLSERAAESWDHVMAFLRDRRDLAPRILADFAHEPNFRHRDPDEHAGLASITPARSSQLLALLLELFPPPDPGFGGSMARTVTPEDSARELRNRLMNWLEEQGSGEAVLALRHLEQTYGAKNPWLRRPRARAERSFRLSRWGPIPPRSVAELLLAENKRLIRSESDAAEGVREALELYGCSLRHDSPSDLEDFWDLPRGRPPTPKAEERVSDKLCQAIRRYFDKFAVTADREVQVFRRKLPRDAGGAPGSEVDVFASVPAVGSMEGDRITIPIEVKLSGNMEARTGLRGQLVDRYMSESGASRGVFVVVWMDAPNLPSNYRPVWSTLDVAMDELKGQAQEVSEASKGASTVVVVVIDARLPTIPHPTRRAARGQRKQSKPPALKPQRDPSQKARRSRRPPNPRRKG